MTLLLVAAGIGVLAALRWPRHQYPRNVLWGVDVTWAAATGSPRGQTLSDAIGDKVRANRWWAKLADIPFLGHFMDTVEAHQRVGLLATSVGYALGAVAFFAWLWARHAHPETLVRYVENPLAYFLLAWLLAQLAIKRLRRE